MAVTEAVLAQRRVAAAASAPFPLFPAALRLSCEYLPTARCRSPSDLLEKVRDPLLLHASGVSAERSGQIVSSGLCPVVNRYEHLPQKAPFACLGGLAQLVVERTEMSALDLRYVEGLGLTFGRRRRSLHHPRSVSKQTRIEANAEITDLEVAGLAHCFALMVVGFAVVKLWDFCEEMDVSQSAANNRVLNGNAKYCTERTQRHPAFSKVGTGSPKACSEMRSVVEATPLGEEDSCRWSRRNRRQAAGAKEEPKIDRDPTSSQRERLKLPIRD